MFDDGQHVRAFSVVEGAACRDSVPFFQARATAGGGGVLGSKHRMAAKGGLFAIVFRVCRCEALIDEILGVLHDDG